MKPSAVVTIGFLCLVTLGHVLRLVFGVPVAIGAFVLPMWASALAVIGPGALAVWLWREHRT